MIDARMPPRERLDNLLADRALFGISEEERAELDSLLPKFPEIDAECYERIAASVDVAIGLRRLPPLPDSLRARVRQQASAQLAGCRGGVPHEPTPNDVGLAPARRRFGYRESIPWVLAATAVAAAIAVWVLPQVIRAKAPTVAELRTAMIEQTADLRLVDWLPSEDPTALKATGDVVWSDAEQRGYMRFRKLLANDPGKHQYQLWIFDAQRDERYPIDGGVFDVGVGQEDVVVPIRANLNVFRPVMFAVTVERSGGVVVSNRERICLLAKFDG